MGGSRSERDPPCPDFHPAARPAKKFSLTSCEVLSAAKVLTLACQRSARKALLVVGLSLLGRTADANELLKEIFDGTPFARYHEWRVRGERPLDLAGLEAQQDNWHQTPHVRVVIQTGGKEPSALEATLDSSSGSPHLKWSLALVGKAVKGPGEASGKSSASRMPRRHITCGTISKLPTSSCRSRRRHDSRLCDGGAGRVRVEPSRSVTVLCR